MSDGKGNTGLLTIIAVVLIAIAGIMLYQANQDTPAEQAAESIEEVGDEIGDAVSGN